MSTVSKSVAISPSAAAAAGCTAQCLGEYTDDGERGWTALYTLSASAAPGWHFVKFTWLLTYTDENGVQPSVTHESKKNPTDWENDSIYELRYNYPDSISFFECHASNITAIFEQDAPKTYTVRAYASPSNGGTVQVGSAKDDWFSVLTNITAGSTIQVKATPAAGFVFSRWSDGGDATHNITVNSDMNLDAYFTLQLTHLLVNSSTVESPAHLVYDPATNLLVADY